MDGQPDFLAGLQAEKEPITKMAANRARNNFFIEAVLCTKLMHCPIICFPLHEFLFRHC
jgi:hypothetical protein